MSEDAQRMAQLLLGLTQPDTNTIRQAEQALKPLLKDSRCVPALVEVLKARGVEPDGTRQVAAVILRKRMGSHYSKFDQPTRTALKTELLTILANEPQRLVRNGAVGVAAVMCKEEAAIATAAAHVAAGGKPPKDAPLEQKLAAERAAATKGGAVAWPELFHFIATAASDANPEARELAFLLLAEMTETIGRHLKPQFASMATLYTNALTDSQTKVQNASVKSLGLLLSYLSDEPEVDHFAALIPPVIAVASACQSRGDVDVVNTILDVLYELCYCSSAAVAVHLRPIVQFCCVCVNDESLEISVRDLGALVIATMAETKPKAFGREEALVGSVLDGLLSLIENSKESAAGALFDSNPAWKEEMKRGGAAGDDNSNPDYEGDDDDEDGEEDRDMDSPTDTSMAQGTLDMLACELPAKYIFQPVMSRCMTRLASPHPHHRKAGIAGLGVIAEGCARPLRVHLPDVMPHVFTAAADADAQVRECACFALGQISEHCQPEILGYASQILPIAFALLDDTTVEVQATSCYVLEMFCERLDPEAVRPLLDPLIRKLAAMIESSHKRSVREMAVAALAATAVAAEDEFSPYVQGVGTLLTNLMGLQDEETFSLRGRALECMGHISIAVGREVFRPYFPATLRCACEGLTFDSSDLSEFAYAAFANLAKAMEDEFGPALPELVPHLMEIIGTEDEQVIVDAEERDNGQFAALADSDDEGDDEGGNLILPLRTPLMDAKKGAITALGEMAAHSGSAFVPHLEVSMQALQQAASSWSPLIKSEVASALANLVKPSIAAHHEGGSVAWEKGQVDGGSGPMHRHTSDVAKAVLSELETLMKDDDKTTVGKACEGVQTVMELCGPHSLAPIGRELLDNSLDLLKKEAPCQIEEEEYFGDAPAAGAGEETEEGEEDKDSYMLAVFDLIGGFARVLGPHFLPQLKEFLPEICAYTKTSRPPSDRSMALGCLGEIAHELDDGIREYWQSVFWPAVLDGLADEDESVKRNAAFCAGVCCQALGESICAQYYPPLLQSISPLFSVDATAGETSAACVDNAAAAVTRMIMAGGPAHVPMPQVLPVVLKALPLKNDMTENDTVYNCLLGLLQMNQPDAVANKAELRRVFTEATAEGSPVEEEIQQKLRVALQALH